MHIELTHDYAPEQILVPLELQEKPIHTIISDEPEIPAKSKRSIGSFLLETSMTEYDIPDDFDELFARDASTVSV